MPFTSIDAAKEAKFPTTADDIALTLAQINQLAKFHDAIKTSGSTDNPMAVAWTQWKNAYHITDGTWVTAEFTGAEVPVLNYDPKTHIVKAIKAGTIAGQSDGGKFVCTPEWMKAHAEDWTGGNLISNHYGLGSKVHGSIKRSWLDFPFINMELEDINPETERRMMAEEHTGFSFDASGSFSDPIGTNLSILFYPHVPVCKSADGCGLAAEDLTESQSLNDTIIGGTMPEGKTLTEQEIVAMKAEVADVTNLRADVKRLGAEVTAQQTTIDARDATITEQSATMGEMFTAEDVETKVVEAKKTLFTAEDVETAKKEAADVAIAAEQEKVGSIAAELASITKMFPDGIDDTFRTEVFAMVQEGRSHDALVKLGEIDYTKLQVNVPTGSGNGQTTEAEADADVGGVGTYDPVTRKFSSEVA